ncbi:hypothetical protein NE237_011024 [Protea cynaroides]|uniref:Uncharacterized protein n=1 Tax=Protea cynaroides TaxID=273540 RepID=A0A9Q0JWD6_9MAGN|nr:hypothetical protein NE237_011024 [Protea cynaroides]
MNLVKTMREGNEPADENDRDSAPRQFEEIQSRLLLGFFSKLLDPDSAPKSKPTLQPLSVICNNTMRGKAETEMQKRKSTVRGRSEARWRCDLICGGIRGNSEFRLV